MLAHPDSWLTGGEPMILALCLFLAFGLEFINGFHDAANAVATVIYTNSLRPRAAVVLSGLCNFAGVFVGGIAVAVGILELLPPDLLVSGHSGASLAMVLSLLLAAIVWNLGTWYIGLPVSSSHTLIGAILGVGLARSTLAGHRFGDGVNWGKAWDIGLSLLLSPLLGMSLAALAMLLLQQSKRHRALLEPPARGLPPPRGVRRLLTLTCCGVSFAHGSNDGQKGVGIVMLILIGLVPAGYSLDLGAAGGSVDRTVQAALALEAVVHDHGDRAALPQAGAATDSLAAARARLAGKATVDDIPCEERFLVRQTLLRADEAVDALVKSGGLGLSAHQASAVKEQRKALRALVDYAPTWVLVAIAATLGVGTTIGWRRIVITVGEKIGKTHLTYAQGASAELVAMVTIGLSALLGLPVSTTHVLSSGIAGTMLAQRSGLQRATVRNIALAWALTLPVSMALGAALYLLLRFLLA